MCELLALSSSQPARLTFSLHTLAARGGLLCRSHDGWGVAFCEGFDVALYREPRPAGDSALVQLLETQGPATGLAISHIRHATQGQVSLANTQPFGRQLGGRTHIFAHNGDLTGIQSSGTLDRGAYQPADQGAGLAVRTDGTSVVWVASVPLTDDPWQPLNCGELLAIRDGVILAGPSTISAADRADHAF